MVRESDILVLREFADRVRGVFPEARIWAFGSRVRGDAAPDSDLDICVVHGDARPDAEARVRRIAWEVGFERELLIAPLCYGNTEFSQGPRAASPLVRSILAEGMAV